MKFPSQFIHFTAQQFDEAKPLLDAIPPVEDDLLTIKTPITISVSFLFFQKKYRDALDAFTVVEDHETYGR